jgi:hypothetical protein
MPKNLSDRRAQRVADFLKKVQSSRGRLIFVLDATASRQPAWDSACQLQAEMFQKVAKIGGLEVQLVYYRGPHECSHSCWTLDARELAEAMSRIRCETGHTKIGKALAHVREENRAQKVNAFVFVGDAMEENPCELHAAAAGLGCRSSCSRRAMIRMPARRSGRSPG